MTKKEAILERSKSRKASITVTQINAKSDSNNALTPFLSPLESWEMIAKISRDLYWLEFNREPSSRIDKQTLHIVKKM